ncbi:hypothetical protein L9W92_11460 [Pelotomaculum terephthalicicum JT]|nr:hypothetical protein [Pelotomaculum terephthalicicum]MCG9968665.1 hypothetical protein [Pelotomaculum terephthalicicum JT]
MAVVWGLEGAEGSDGCLGLRDCCPDADTLLTGGQTVIGYLNDKDVN